MDQMEAKLNQVESDVREMKLTIENEICVNIQRVAEGHLDLSRNLHEAMKVETEKGFHLIHARFHTIHTGFHLIHLR